MHTLDQHVFVYQDDAEFLGSLPGGLGERIRPILAEIGPASSADFFDLLESLVQSTPGHPRITVMACPVAPQWCSDDLLKKIRERSTEYGIPIHLHCVESPYQRAFGFQSYGESTVEHLNGLGFLGPDVSFGHAVWMSEGDMDICASDRDVRLPQPELEPAAARGHPACSSAAREGVNVSIGMDGTTINDDEDMLQELRLVAKLHRLPRGLYYAACPTSEDVLRMATANGARSMTLQDSIGNLRPARRRTSS